MAVTGWKIHRTAIGQRLINVVLCDDDPAFLKAFNDEVSRAFAKLNVNADIGTFVKAGGIPSERLLSPHIKAGPVKPRLWAFEHGLCAGSVERGIYIQL